MGDCTDEHDRRLEPSAFKPAPYLFKYARILAASLAENRGLPRQKAVASLLGVHEVTLCRTLRRPGARRWVAEEIRRYLGDWEILSQLIRARVYGKALAGDLEAARLFFQLTGELTDRGLGRGDSAAVNQTTITMLIPASPGEMLALSPPPMPDATPQLLGPLPPEPPR